MAETISHVKKYWKMYFFYVLIFSGLIVWIWFVFFSGKIDNVVRKLEWFIHNKQQFIYLLAFLISVAEGTIVLAVIPGGIYIVTMGVFLAQGNLDPWVLFPTIISGAVLGDLLGYAVGSFTSANLKKWKKNNIEDNEYYLLGQKFIKKHGGKSVFFARFISGVKEIVPAVAGVLGMDMKKFMFYNFLGAIGWSLEWVGIGYFAGSYIKEIDNIVKSISLVLLFSFFTAIVVFYKKNKKRKEIS